MTERLHKLIDEPIFQFAPRVGGDRDVYKRQEQPDSADKDFLECMNPDSLQVLTGCKVERALVAEAEKYDAEGDDRAAKTAPGFQFMRVGYFCLDNRDCHKDHLVFNRSVSLKDSFKPAK